MKLTKSRIATAAVSAMALIWLSIGSSRPAQAQTFINFGDNLYGSYCNSEIDSLKFYANEGDRVILYLTAYGDFGGRCSPGRCAFDQWIDLRDEVGLLIAENSTAINYNDCFWTTRIGLSDVRLSRSGQYTILVHDIDYWGGGQYALFLQRTNQPSRTETLYPGDSLLERIDSCGQVRTYTFSADSGYKVTITMTPAEVGNVNPRLELYEPHGRLIAKPGTGTIEQVLTSSGTYTLLAYSALCETGTFRIGLSAFSTPVRSTTWGQLKATYR